MKTTRKTYFSPAIDVFTLNTQQFMAASTLTTSDPSVTVSDESYSGTFSGREDDFNDEY